MWGQVISPLQQERHVELQIRYSAFDIPPIQDALIIGNRAPIGPVAARMMMEAVSPEQFEVVQVNHDLIQAIVVRKSLFRFLPQDRLIPTLLESAAELATAETLLKIKIDVETLVHREVQV